MATKTRNSDLMEAMGGVLTINGEKLKIDRITSVSADFELPLPQG